MAGWSPESWRSFPIKQAVTYPDQSQLKAARAQLSSMPPLVAISDIKKAREQLAEVAAGKRFLLQGGDCAERFMDCTPAQIESKLRIMVQMSLVLTWGARIPTMRMARMAGQFAKPRSQPTEIVDGKEVTTFRGDLINGFDVADRVPDPNRLVQGYFHSAATLNYAHTLLKDGFANLYDVAKWNMGFLGGDTTRHDSYREIVEEVMDSLDFAETCGIGHSNDLHTVDLFVCHEALTLEYEEALTRKSGEEYYNTSAQFVWIGDRTRQLDHAHVEYFRGIANPVGIKVGPKSDPEEIVAVVKALWPNPAASPGKVTLITRMGADKVRELLPVHIKAMQKAELPVVWVCDPCHGNTHTTPNGYKTRDVDQILDEIRISFEVHAELNSHLGGVHFELTGEHVTECIGGPHSITHKDLPQQYTTYCDPRLNYDQSMEVAFLLARLIANQKGKRKRRDFLAA